MTTQSDDFDTGTPKRNRHHHQDVACSRHPGPPLPASVGLRPQLRPRAPAPHPPSLDVTLLVQTAAHRRWPRPDPSIPPRRRTRAVCCVCLLIYGFVCVCVCVRFCGTLFCVIPLRVYTAVSVPSHPLMVIQRLALRSKAATNI